MTFSFSPAIPLDEARPWSAGQEALAHQVRMVLETRPGQLPWRPEFGCDLEEIVGYCATPDVVSFARSRVRSALRRSLRGVTVTRCDVRVVSNDAQGFLGERSLPAAEAALTPVGVSASIFVDLEIQGPAGTVSMSANLTG